MATTSNRRKKIRYAPDEEVHALLRRDEGGPAQVGLIFDESYTGCSLVVVLLEKDSFKSGDTVTVKVGKLHEMPAEVKWVKRLEDRVVRLGLSYL